MRKTIVRVLALFFFGGGLVVAIAGIRFGQAHNSREDVLAATFIGAMLVIIGVTLFFAARKAGGRIDPDTVTAVGVAHMMTMDDGSDTVYDDFGD